MEDFRPTEIAEQYGTPTYVMNLDIVRDNFKGLEKSITKAARESKLFYAVKANPLLSILTAIRNMGGGAEVVSRGEIEAAVRAGFRGDDMIFNGPGKTRGEIERALGLGVYSINVESLEELVETEKIAKALSTRCRVGFRINPGLLVRTHKYLAVASRGSKFGLDPRNYVRALEAASRSDYLRPVGIHMHIGSQISLISEFKRAFGIAMHFVRVFEDMIGEAPDFIDLGGGIALNYKTGRPSIAWDRISSEAISELTESHAWPRGAKLLMEPGRAIVGNAGILLTRVLYVKESTRTNWAITDAGMNCLMRTALYGTKHRIASLAGKRGKRTAYMIGGPICESGDTFGRYFLPALARGDLLAILDAGAYGSSMSSNYNGQPRPATVVVDSGSFRMAERREDLEDLFIRQIGPQ